jgi:hypothetical protein
MYKQRNDKISISVPTRQSSCIFEISTSSNSSGNSVNINLLSGGTINSFLPSNLFGDNGDLVSFTVNKNQKWFLIVKGNLDTRGNVTTCTLAIKTTPPEPIEVTKNRPPLEFEFAIYAGKGPSHARMIGCSPYIRSVILFKEYSYSNNILLSDYTDHYTLVFA